MEGLALAQHFGLSTRLLDWSHNPLVALFFAVESNSDDIGCVYCYSPKLIMDASVIDTNTFSQIACYLPPPLDNRILAQQGLFSFHPEPNIELEAESLPDNMLNTDPNPFEHGKNLIRFVVEPKLKQMIKKQLDAIGINRKYLFADLDGLSKYINWQTETTMSMKK